MLPIGIALALFAPVPEVRLSDADRFPPEAECWNQRYQLEKFKWWLQWQAENNPVFATQVYQEALWNQAAWAEREMTAWNQLALAASPSVETDRRLCALREVREYLGPDRYVAGIPPLPVPDWWRPDPEPAPMMDDAGLR